jgi:hypothetical protein
MNLKNEYHTSINMPHIKAQTQKQRALEMLAAKGYLTTRPTSKHIAYSRISKSIRGFGRRKTRRRKV